MVARGELGDLDQQQVATLLGEHDPEQPGRKRFDVDRLDADVAGGDLQPAVVEVEVLLALPLD